LCVGAEVSSLLEELASFVSHFSIIFFLGVQLLEGLKFVPFRELFFFFCIVLGNLFAVDGV
jgi:hypothetical protein